MSHRRLAWLRGLPRDALPLDELDHVVLSDLTLGQRHGEDVADGAHALTGRGVAQVLVAVPLGLPRRVGDQLEHSARWCRHLPRRRGDLALGCHGRSIAATDAPDQRVSAHLGTRPGYRGSDLWEPRPRTEAHRVGKEGV